MVFPKGSYITRGARLHEKQLEGSARRKAITREMKSAVFRLDKGECVYCSSQRLLQVDHIQPVCLRGTNEIENLVRCWDRCNSQKGNRTTPPPLVFGRFRAVVEGLRIDNWG